MGFIIQLGMKVTLKYDDVYKNFVWSLISVQFSLKRFYPKLVICLDSLVGVPVNKLTGFKDPVKQMFFLFWYSKLYITYSIIITN